MDDKSAPQESQNSTPPEVEDVNQNPTTPNLYSSEPPKKSSKKKLFIILLVLLVVVGGSAAAWYLKDSKQQDNSADTPNTAQNSGDNQTQTKELLPNTIVYAFREKDNQPFSLYWRPAAGGDRTEAQKLSTGEYVNSSTVHGNQVAVLTSGGDTTTAIWYSSDGGKKYQKIFSEPKTTGGTIGTQITSLIFSTDGKSIAFGYLPDEKLNTIKEIKLDDSSKTSDLFTSGSRGVFLVGYDHSAKQILFFEGCFNCDANLSRELLVRDLVKNTTSTLIKSETGSISPILKDDFSELLVTYGTSDTKNEESLGSDFSAPYNLKAFEIKSKKESPIASVGKNEDNFLINTGYIDNEEDIYYSYNNQLFSVKANKPALLFESSKEIDNVYFASYQTVITRTGEFEDFVVNLFNISDKSNKVILNGDGNTTVFGVTLN